MLPNQYLKLNRYEKAFIIAAINIKTENDKEREQKIKRIGK
jgi:hypothetical protein